MPEYPHSVLYKNHNVPYQSFNDRKRGGGSSNQFPNWVGDDQNSSPYQQPKSRFSTAGMVFQWFSNGRSIQPPYTRKGDEFDSSPPKSSFFFGTPSTTPLPSWTNLTVKQSETTLVKKKKRKTRRCVPCWNNQQTNHNPSSPGCAPNGSRLSASSPHPVGGRNTATKKNLR